MTLQELLNLKIISENVRVVDLDTTRKTAAYTLIQKL